MASVTLAESGKLAQDELVAGIIENIITVNEMFDLLPFDGIDGNSLAYNRENTLGDVQVAGVGATITAKNPATFTRVNSNLTTIVGDAEVNGLIQATRSSDGNDQEAVQIASKAKSAGRNYQNQLINGTGTGDQFSGLIQLCANDQILDTGVNGVLFQGANVFSVLDDLISAVTDKDGQVDYLVMHDKARNLYYAALRALPGAGINETIELPSGRRVPSYRGIPIFRNDWIPINQTKGSSANCTSVFAGTLDDGSRTHGIAGLTARNMAGIQLVDVGEKETADEHIWRVKWYCGLALFSEKGLAMADGIRLQ